MTILTITVWLSVATNVMVMGLTSEQLKTCFPKYFKDLGDTHTARKEGVELMVGIEHALLLLGLLITYGIRKTPAWVRDDIERRNFEKDKAALKERVKTLESSASASH